MLIEPAGIGVHLVDDPGALAQQIVAAIGIDVITIRAFSARDVAVVHREFDLPALARRADALTV